MFKLVDTQIVLGYCLRHLFEGLISDKDIFVVRNGIKAQAYSSLKSHRNNEGPIRFLFLSNLVPSKGALELLKAVQIAYTTCSNIEVVVAGASTDRKYCQNLNDYLSRHPNLPVILTGPVTGKDKMTLLGNAHVFVMPTYYPAEGLPWVLIEAMGAGLPIISTRQGAIEEIVLDRITGLIVAKRDSTDLAQAIAKLATSKRMRNEMSSKTQQHFETYFTEERMVSDLDAAFAHTLKSTRTHSYTTS